MTVQVPRHDIPSDRVRSVESLVQQTEERIGRLEGNAYTFNLALNNSVRVAQTHCALDPDAARIETWEAWVAAMQIGSALFQSATSTEPTVTCRINGKMRTIPSTGPTSHADAGNWLTAFHLAAICREHDRLTRLSNVPISLLRESGAVYDEYIYDWVDTLQTYWKQGPDLGDKLVAAVDGTAPERLQIVDRSTMLRFLYPPINLLYRLIRGEADRYNAELVKALEWHKEYWTEDEASAARATGLVAIGPLAITCLALDADITIDVESGYLPKYLLDGSWVNAFPT
ncbi:immunity 49 family protein [Streptomyces sp. NPDC003016]